MVSALFSFTIVALSFRPSQAMLEAAGNALLGYVADTVHQTPPRPYVTIGPHNGNVPYSGPFHDPQPPHPDVVTVVPQPTTPLALSPGPREYHIVRPHLLFPPLAAPDRLTTGPPRAFNAARLSSSAFPPSDNVNYHMPPDTSVASLEKHFSENPELEAAASEQMLAITTGKSTPMSINNLRIWKKENQGYQALSTDEQAEILLWIEKKFFDGNRDKKSQDDIIGYVWSLQQLGRRKTVWWSKSLIDNGDPANHGYIDLVQAGDLLRFFNTRKDFRFTNEEVSQIAPQLRDILAFDVNQNPRNVGLDIKQLMAYEDSASVSMYQTRTGQMMKSMLRKFDQQTPTQQERILQDLFLFTGTRPSEVIQQAQKALKKDSKDFSELLRYDANSHGQEDYARIQAELKKLGT